MKAKEARIAPDRNEFVTSASQFAMECAVSGVAWKDVWPSIETTCERAGIALTVDEKLSLFEAHAEAYWREAA